ncbi:MAG TPA: rhodanese-like domain-containing protein [Kineosporiaceae bacterium]|nr:rhodanese-like domain-containing protein [Kineosporiaceae bacterium]
MSYAGDLTPDEAYQLLESQPDAILVDVRTKAEWSYVGVPDLSEVGRPLVLSEWVTFPDGARNPQFLDDLTAAAKSTAAPVVFLCRSGVRSVAAAQAATEAGFTAAYNITEGFEGPSDASGHRGTAAGWKVRGLPWRQS